MNIFIGMNSTKHSVFTTVVSGKSYGKIRGASPKTRNLQKCLKYSEERKNSLKYFGIFLWYRRRAPVLRPSLLQPHFNKTLSAISPHRRQKVFSPEKLWWEGKNVQSRQMEIKAFSDLETHTDSCQRTSLSSPASFKLVEKPNAEDEDCL